MLRLASLLLILLALNFAQFAHSENRPVWRGPRGDGTSLETNLPTHDLGEKCFPSPAVSDGNILIRGEKHLFCFGHSSPGPRE